jgi:hypothetical protein
VGRAPAHRPQRRGGGEKSFAPMKIQEWIIGLLDYWIGVFLARVVCPPSIHPSIHQSINPL